MLESVSTCWVRVILREILEQFPRCHHMMALSGATADGESSVSRGHKKLRAKGATISNRKIRWYPGFTG